VDCSKDKNPFNSLLHGSGGEMETKRRAALVGEALVANRAGTCRVLCKYL
jgi:hypothetical protein